MRIGSDRTRRAARPGKRLRRAGILIAAAAAVLAGASTVASATSAVAATQAGVGVKHACATPAKAGTMQCFALINTTVQTKTAAQIAATPNATPSGYGPSQFQSAYNLASAAASSGSGETVAIVDAYDYPTAQADLNTYRSQYGLPACGSGCFTKVNQNGSATPVAPAAGSTGWDVEEALDIDMVSAICPLCHITLVEANSPNNSDLYTAENTAASLAKFVSNSWGGSEYSGEASDASTYFNHPGVSITVSAGDTPGPEFPAEAPDVTAVGGTTLSTSSNSRGWTESNWSDSGGGCSTQEPKPTWQSSFSGCSKREDNDVSADANPSTGAALYNSYSAGGWEEVGGTSESSPIIAATYALGGNPTAGTYPVQNIWTRAPAGLYPVGSGYSSVPGWGTPDGTSAFAPSGGGTGGNTVTVTNPGSQTTATGTAVSKQITATDSASGQTLTFSATGLPTGLSISTSGLITGTASTAGTYSVTVSAHDTTGATGSASFTWTVSTSGGGGGCTAAQLLGNPGFETGSAAPWTTTADVVNENGSGETSHSGSWYAWLDGYGTTHTDTAAQSVSVPSGCSTYTASFYLHIDTAETTTSTQYDKLSVQVLSSTGSVLSTLATFSNLNHNTGYTQHSYNLAAYAGQHISLKFTGTEDSSLQTSFVIDDTAINVS
ncbi:MAG TPA: putative Ig domain-containing protein [Trebonia sp.]|nr:putative Ig domain-containing protein [Trebonia sp.]